MAAGDLYVYANNNLFVREISDGTWSHVHAGPSGIVGTAGRGLTVGQNGVVYIGSGSALSPVISAFENGAWSNTTLTKAGQIEGIGIDADGLIHIGIENDIYRVASGNPSLGVTFPNDSFGSPARLTGLSVHQADGRIAICAARHIWELPSGGDTWTESVIPSNVVNTILRNFSSVCYDHLGGLWVYDSQNQRFYHRDATDGTWASDAQIPTTVDSISISRNTILGTGFEQAQATSGVENLKFGGADIGGIKFGTEDVSSIYLGDTKVWG